MSFDGLAPHYRWLELVLAGETLQRCRTAYLREVPVPESVFIAGEGNGRFLLACRRHFPDAQITVVDASSRMLELSRRRLQKHRLGVDGVRFVAADILTWQPPEEAFQLIVTHFFLDCFAPPQICAAVTKLSQLSQHSSDWLISDFQIPPKGLARVRAKIILRLLYWFFGVTTQIPARELTAPDEFLQAVGFSLQQRTISDWGLLRCDWWRRQEARPGTRATPSVGRIRPAVSLPVPRRA